MNKQEQIIRELITEIGKVVNHRFKDMKLEDRMVIQGLCPVYKLYCKSCATCAEFEKCTSVSKTDYYCDDWEEME